MRGATGHYEAVVGAATSGTMNATVDTGVPVVFNVLTCDTMEQVRWSEWDNARDGGSACV